jgi:hypothetical protein
MDKFIGFKHCQKHHIVGRMRRNGSGVLFLELFRQAIDYGQDIPEEVDVMGIVYFGEGFRCSICDGLVDFYQSRPRKAARVAFE